MLRADPGFGLGRWWDGKGRIPPRALCGSIQPLRGFQHVASSREMLKPGFCHKLNASNLFYVN